MNAWSFPQTIAPNTCPKLYVEWDITAGKNVGDDAGEVEYVFPNGDKFQVQATSNTGLTNDGGHGLMLNVRRILSPLFS